MKKIILVLSLIGVFILTGCGAEKGNQENRENNTSIEEQEIGFAVKEFAGQWKSSDEGYEANYVDIIARDIDVIDFEYMMVSDAPDYRVANIEVKNVLINKEGIGTFEFEEDGWNHKGKGTIKLGADGVEIIILNMEDNKEVEEESLWGISSGKYNKKLEES